MADEMTSPPRTPRRVKLLLFVSLAINLIVVGLIVGAIASGGPHGGKGGERGWGTPFTRALEREERRAIGRDIRQSFAEMGKSQRPRALRHAAHTEALALLRADPFDSAAFVAAMGKQADVVQLMAMRGAQSLARHLETLSPEARAAYADRVEEAMTRRRGPKK